MKLEGIINKNGSMTVEYDEEAKDMLIKAGIYSSIQKAIDIEKIAELEHKLEKANKRIKRLRKKLYES